MSSQPWKDFDRLEEVQQECDTQKEMAEKLGCSAATVSNWLGKKEESEEFDRYSDPTKCHLHDVCGNDTPGAGNTLCENCLDVLRYFEADSMSSIETVEELYEKYDETH
jgi:transcriptional regulator with XRE-family HTH domain